MILLKQSTAATIKMGPFLDDTDGKTAETGLTIAQADIRLSKNGGDIAQSNNVAGATHDELGYYGVPLDTTDTGTLGNLRVAIHESGALPVWQDFMVVTANVYDTLCSTDLFDVNVTHIADTAQTANDNGADINAILTDTTEIGAAGAGLTAVPWNASWDAEVQSECTDALTAYDPPTDTEMVAAFTEIKGATWAAGTDTLEHIRNKQTDIEADTNELQTDWTNGGRLDLLIDELTTQGDTNETKLDTIDTVVDSILADTGTDGVIVATNNDKTGYALSTAGNNAIWDATSATLSLSFETIIDRLYRFFINKMNITDATGAVALRNEGDSADLATQTITDDDTTTTRTALSWV